MRCGPASLSLTAAALLSMVLAGCGQRMPKGLGSVSNAGTGGQASVDEPPSFSDQEWAVLRELAPAELPGPVPDVSNAYADNPAAAALGKKLFNDPLFSGQLLDKDNDGGPNSLGERGAVGRVSCSGCHVPAAGFLDNRSTFLEISLGTGWTHRRTPSLLDVGQAKLVTWGGRHSTLWSQPFGPLENPLEMNSSRLFVAQEIARRYKAEYEAVFGANELAPLADTARFPALTAEQTGCTLTRTVDRPRALPPNEIYDCHGMPGDGAEFDGMAEADRNLVTRIVANMGKALAAYQRRLSCGPGRFDAWVHGDAGALTPAEQRGAKIFIGSGGCVACHSGPFFSDQAFHNTGLREVVTKEGILNNNDRGAGADLPAAAADPVGITGPYSDGNDGRLPEVLPEFEGAFRTPTLRCVSRRPTYMHSGTMHSLEEVVAFFQRGGDPDGYPGVGKLVPFDSSTETLRDLVAFLRTLEGPGPAAELLRP